MEVNLSLESTNKIYYAGDNILGSVLIINKSKSTMKFNLVLTVIGRYTFRKSRENPPKVKTQDFYKKSFNVLTDSYSTQGANNPIRFKFPLTSDGCQSGLSSLYETYHGVAVSIGYEIYAAAVCAGKQFESKSSKILVLVPGQGINRKFGRKRVSYQFSLNPKNIQTNQLNNQNLMPKFQIDCFLENVNCCIDKPFNGFCNIKECSTQIKSIELQFMRNEKILDKEFQSVGEASEIQNLQIGDGDVIRNLDIPVFMIFPRGFCCANLDTKEVCLSFEMNLTIVLVNGVVISENYPVNLWRG